jgi:hypothetical protein
MEPVRKMRGLEGAYEVHRVEEIRGLTRPDEIRLMRGKYG